MRVRKSKLLLSLLAVMLCLTAFTVPAFAGDDSWCEYGDYGTEDAGTTASPSETETQKPTPAPETQETSTAPETQNPSPVLSQEQAAKPSGNSAAETGSKSKPQQSAAATPAPAKPTATTPTDPDASQEGKEEADPSGDGEIGKGTPLTPEGNLNLVDDVVQSGDGDASEPEEKQFIVVQSKNGNYFYLIIDRSGDTENVHFLNQVDEADLMALIEDGTVESEPLVCTCTDKCKPGDIDTSCPVCQVAMSECQGTEAEPEPTPDTDTDTDSEQEPEKAKAGSAVLPVIVLVVALAAGGAVYYFKFRKPKPDTKGPVDLDDYDFGEDETDDFPLEPDDDDEPEERNEGD